MQLEDYFDFETFETKFGPVERIRIKDRRVPIDMIIESYLNGSSPESICRDQYPGVTLEEVFATLTYYLRNKDRVSEYLRRGEEIGELHYQEWLAEEAKNPSPLLARLREKKRQNEAMRSAAGI